MYIYIYIYTYIYIYIYIYIWSVLSEHTLYIYLPTLLNEKHVTQGQFLGGV